MVYSMRQSVVGLAVLVCLLSVMPVQADTKLEALIGTWHLLIKADKGQSARFTFDHLQASGKGLEGFNRATKSKALIFHTPKTSISRLSSHEYQMATADITGTDEILCANFYFTNILPYMPDESKQLIFGSVILSVAKRTEEGDKMWSQGLPGFDCGSAERHTELPFVGVRE